MAECRTLWQLAKTNPAAVPVDDNGRGGSLLMLIILRKAYGTSPQQEQMILAHKHCDLFFLLFFIFSFNTRAV